MDEAVKNHKLTTSVVHDCGLGLPYIGRDETRDGDHVVSLGDDALLYRTVRPDYFFF